MPHDGVTPDSLSIVEQISVRQEFEAPQEPAEVIALPTHDDLLQRFDELSSHIDDNLRTAPSHLVDRAVISAALTAYEPETDAPAHIANIIRDVQNAEDVQYRVDLSIRPHETWRESFLELFVRQPQRERKPAVKYFNTQTNTTEVAPESDASLELRRYLEQSLFISSLEHARVERLIRILSDAHDATDPKTERVAFVEIAQKELKPKDEIEPVDAKISQARAVLMAGIHGEYSEEMKTSLLNLALDTAMERVNALGNQNSVATAEAYLISGRAVHDLASRPGSFPQLSESEAREFRVRALELAHDFVSQAATIYEDIYDNPIGPVNAETYAEVRKRIQAFEQELPLINEARWFRGIYEGDYEMAATSYNERVRQIGREGLLRALTVSLPRTGVPQELVSPSLQ